MPNIFSKDKIKNQEQKVEIQKKKSAQNSIIYKITNVQNSRQIIDVLRDVSVDWEVLLLEKDTVENTQYKKWLIEWNLFDIRLLPFIHIDYMIRINRAEVEIGRNLNLDLSTQTVFEIEDIEGETNVYYKKVKFVSSIYYENVHISVSLTNVYEARLNAFLINPRNYL